jgi:hypothetical protein
MDKVIERTVALLLLINAGVICWVAGSMALEWSGWAADVQELPQDAIRGPEQHLPLAGMEGADYPPKEACLRLNGFLMEMARALGGSFPVSPKKIGAIIESERCSLDDPDVRSIITAFRAAYEDADIEPLAAFAQMDLPARAAKPKSRKRSRKRQPERASRTGNQPLPHPADDMFPIAGMPSYTGEPDQACSTLSRFLDVMDRKLREAGAEPPLEGSTRDGLLDGSCSLEDATLAATLGVYRDAFSSRGIRPLPPFEFFRDPPGAQVGAPPSKGKKPPLPEQADGAP